MFFLSFPLSAAGSLSEGPFEKSTQKSVEERVFREKRVLVEKACLGLQEGLYSRPYLPEASVYRPQYTGLILLDLRFWVLRFWSSVLTQILVLRLWSSVSGWFSQKTFDFPCFSRFFSDFSRLFSTSRCTDPGVHPPVHRHPTYTSSVAVMACTYYTARHARGALLLHRAVGLGGIRNRFFQLKTCTSRPRFDRRRAGSTSLCQAKSLKCLRIQFYSASLNMELPQMSSFSGPSGARSNGRALEC